MARLGMMIFSAGMLLLASCASTNVAEQQSTAQAEGMARPERVLVYDFAGSRDDLPPDSAIVSYYDQRDVPQTQAEIDLGHKLGRLVAQALVKELTSAGIPAQLATEAPAARAGDAVIRGEFVVVKEGSRTKRVLIGFGAGAGQLSTLAEVYQVTPDGLSPLGATQVNAAGGKLPGMLVPLGFAAGSAASVATTAATSGASNVMQERGPESLDGAAQRTAKALASMAVDAYRKRGWL